MGVPPDMVYNYVRIFLQTNTAELVILTLISNVEIKKVAIIVF